MANEEIDYDAGTVLEALNDKVDRDFGNVPSNFVNFAKYSKNVTNCITEIPQDIKLELTDGTLTLKAGSKVYVPNGFEADGVTPKFDVVIIESDLTSSVTSNETKTFFMVYNFTTGKIMTNWLSSCSSGATVPSGFEYGFFYNTTDNTIFNYTDVKTNNQVSLPLAIFTASSSGISSIDQVFNGFGYIGSTVFALPGVKGLIPNGRNADGSLKNEEFITSKVVTHTWGSETYGTFDLTLKNDNTFNWYSNLLVKSDNYLYNGNTYLGADKLVIGNFSVNSSSDNGKIALFSTKLPFRVVDYNEASGLSAPSEKFINLSIGADKAQYTAPADGYICFSRMATGSNQSVSLYVDGVTTYSKIYSSASNQQLVVSARVGKGKKFNIGYSHSSSDTYLKFVYAEGEN